MALNVPIESQEEASFRGANPLSLRQIAKQFVQNPVHTRTDDSAQTRISNYLKEKMPGASGLVDQYFGSGEDVLGELPDLSLVPNLKNFGRYLTMYSEELGKLGRAKKLSEADRAYAHARVRYPRQSRQVPAEEGELDPRARAVYFDKEWLNYVAEKEKQHPGLAERLDLPTPVPDQPFVRLNNAYFKTTKDAFQDLMHEFTHARQDVKGKAPTLAEKDAAKMRTLSFEEYKKLPWEVGPYRAGDTAARAHEKFEELLEKVPHPQRSRYYSINAGDPQVYDEAGKFISNIPEESFKTEMGLKLYKMLQSLFK